MLNAKKPLMGGRMQSLIEHYVKTRSRRYDVISTQAAHRALSQIVPLHAVPDRALDDMIARQAVAQAFASSSIVSASIRVQDCHGQPNCLTSDKSDLYPG
jgi:hypothetical protein